MCRDKIHQANSRSNEKATQCLNAFDLHSGYLVTYIKSKTYIKLMGSLNGRFRNPLILSQPVPRWPNKTHLQQKRLDDEAKIINVNHSNNTATRYRL